MTSHFFQRALSWSCLSVSRTSTRGVLYVSCTWSLYWFLPAGLGIMTQLYFTGWIQLPPCLMSMENWQCAREIVTQSCDGKKEPAAVGGQVSRRRCSHRLWWRTAATGSLSQLEFLWQIHLNFRAYLLRDAAEHLALDAWWCIAFSWFASIFQYVH